MEKKTQSFGEFIKNKRLAHQPRLTLKKMAEILGVNLTYLSDVENTRKRPFSAEKIELFCEALGLSEKERSDMGEWLFSQNIQISRQPIKLFPEDIEKQSRGDM